jgi:hypothetical protein
MLTQERLKELLHYDPDTGVLTWKARPSKRNHIGDEAGYVFQSGRTHYRRVTIDGIKYLSHRLAWLYTHGKLPDRQIDHGDGNGLHNWIRNLRDVTNRENHKNTRLNSNNTSGTVGVYFEKALDKWCAQICTESGKKSLGYFADIEEAITARKDAEVEYGFHENHGQNRPL